MIKDNIISPSPEFISTCVVVRNNNCNILRRCKWLSQLPRDLRRRSATARLLRLWIRIPQTAWMIFCCVCCVLSGRGLCDKHITRPEESYRLCCFVVFDLETSWMRRPGPALGRSETKNTKRGIVNSFRLRPITNHPLCPHFQLCSDVLNLHTLN
jgi:hypothetical protein